jgi:hypothetical protein
MSGIHVHAGQARRLALPVAATLVAAAVAFAERLRDDGDQPSVEATPSKAGMRWYEIRRAGGT